jgi:hypothetical protein
MMNSESDMKLVSLEQSRPDGRTYDIVPYQFVVYTQYKIPQIIRQEIMDQALDNTKSFIDYGFLNDE